MATLVNDRFQAYTSASGSTLVWGPNRWGALEYYHPDSMLLSLGSSSNNGTALLSDALPISGLNLALFDDSFFTFIEIKFDSPFIGVKSPYLIGRFDSFTLRADNAAPEPNGMALLGLGLAGLAALQRRKN